MRHPTDRDEPMMPANILRCLNLASSAICGQPLVTLIERGYLDDALALAREMKLDALVGELELIGENEGGQ